MWKKSELDQTANATMPVPPQPRVSTPAPLEGATIGPSISIRGEVSGNEDLVIRGRVDGSVNLKEHSVTIGRDGHVHAELHARVVEVEGRLEGDVHGMEQVIVRANGDLRGNVKAPRVSLEDGCRFKGSIDMGSPVESKPQKAPANVSGITEAGALNKKANGETMAKPEHKASSA